MSLEVKVAIRSTVKKEIENLDGNTHSFIVNVQGLHDNHIEHFIKEVVFHLPVHAPNPTQVKKRPPYCVTGFTDSSFRLQIDLFLNASENLNKLSYSYYVLVPDKPVEKSVCVKTLTFLNSPQDFRERLLLGGAELVNHKKKSDAEITHARCKSNPVGSTENQEGVKQEEISNVEVTHAKCKSEPVEALEIQNVHIKEEVCDELSDTNVQNRNVAEENGSLVIQSIYSFEELLKENGTLKQENETLRKKLSDLESVVATYKEKIPVFENNASVTNMELDELKLKALAIEAEITNLKSALQKITSEIQQRKNLNDKGRCENSKVPVISVQNK